MKTTEREFVFSLISCIIKECPRREPTREGEWRAQEMIRHEFEALGLHVEDHEFTFNSSLYTNLSLHFGLMLAGSVISLWVPVIAIVVHLLAGSSFFLESGRWIYLLRRLLPFKRARNVLGILPSSGERKLRIVIAAHADAGSTGCIFAPKVASLFAGGHLPRIFGRGIALATYMAFALAVVDVLLLVLPVLHVPLVITEGVLSIPPLLVFLGAIQVALRNEVVPGANDDLSGVAALPVLAARLAESRPANVEFVFAVTGCEEASMGGADALARDKQREWGRDSTVFLSLDSITNGDISYIDTEGDVVGRKVPSWLIGILERMKNVKRYNPVIGGTDAVAFLCHGYDAVALVAIDPKLGVPRHYHLPGDTLHNLDLDGLMRSIDTTHELIQGIIDQRLGEKSRYSISDVQVVMSTTQVAESGVHLA